jgi:hypothetical protein
MRGSKTLSSSQPRASTSRSLRDRHSSCPWRKRVRTTWTTTNAPCRSSTKCPLSVEHQGQTYGLAILALWRAIYTHKGVCVFAPTRAQARLVLQAAKDMIGGGTADVASFFRPQDDYIGIGNTLAAELEWARKHKHPCGCISRATAPKWPSRRSGLGARPTRGILLVWSSRHTTT